jgi:hypothetical protein
MSAPGPAGPSASRRGREEVDLESATTRRSLLPTVSAFAEAWVPGFEPAGHAVRPVRPALVEAAPANGEHRRLDLAAAVPPDRGECGPEPRQGRIASNIERRTAIRQAARTARR